MHIAADNLQAEVVELLIRSGANPNSIDEFGQTALHFAVDRVFPQTEDEKNRIAEIVSLLLANNIKANTRTQDGETALQWAERYRLKQIGELIRQHGAKECRP